jgi:hypothetical protein
VQRIIRIGQKWKILKKKDGSQDSSFLQESAITDETSLNGRLSEKNQRTQKNGLNSKWVPLFPHSPIQPYTLFGSVMEKTPISS